MRTRHTEAHATDRRNHSYYKPKDILFPSLNSQDDSSEYHRESLVSFAKMQPFFGTRALCRAVSQKDNNPHQPIMNMADPCEIIIPLDLHFHEVDTLEKVASVGLKNVMTDVRWRAVRNAIFLH